LAAATRPIHWDVLDSSRMKYLARLPVSKRLTVEGVSFHIVHATPHDPMDEYLADDAAAWSERLESIDADFVCVGHTHLPFHLELDRVQVLNPGSVGQPRDGDPRCSYAIIENGRVELRRVAYDIDATLTQMKVAGIPADALDFAETVLKNGGYRPDDD
jgi:predicted phosphodiesterase